MTQVLQTTTATSLKMSLFKIKSEFAFFKLFRNYYKSLALSNVGELMEEKRSSSFVYYLNKM